MRISILILTALATTPTFYDNVICYIIKAMRQAYTFKKINWIDITSPTKKEIVDLIEEFSIDPLVAEQLITPSERPKVESFKKYLYLILHFPELTDFAIDGEIKKEIEVDFLVFKNTLVTIHEQQLPNLHEFVKYIELPSFTKNISKDFHAGHLFVLMMRHFYTGIAVQLDDISKNLRIIEDRVFNNSEERMVKVLSDMNRKLLHLKKAIRFHGSTVERFHTSAVTLFGASYTPHVEKILFEYNDLAKTLSGHKEVIEDLWKTNDTLFSARTTDTMRKLTALSFITFPLSLLVSIIALGDFTSKINDFLLVLLGLCGAAAVLVTYLQHKKWL